MEKHTRLIAPYPANQLGLSLSENGSANLCGTVLVYQEPCRVIMMLILQIICLFFSAGIIQILIHTFLNVIELKKNTNRLRMKLSFFQISDI